ncbi:uncharacterized protein N7477_001302 [Penicillium maclennaniae]|uniref:uncharacterized protein n=1 Tax=Penicillium maclennaniae TaxID=1343394 RepID=UPI00253F67CA|nr:uncharacterized protein N7477_001302 [Penicillium maclennaniae]KAJ5681362.1 hypothetical protein N7477_001302 [Penicillium maclennaniae]
MPWPQKKEYMWHDDWKMLPEEEINEWDDLELIDTVQGPFSTSFSAESAFPQHFVQIHESSSFQAIQSSQLHINLINYDCIKYNQATENVIHYTPSDPIYVDMKPECSASTPTETYNRSTKSDTQHALSDNASRPKDTE